MLDAFRKLYSSPGCRHPAAPLTPRVAGIEQRNARFGPGTRTILAPPPSDSPALKLVAPPERRQSGFIEGLPVIAVDGDGVDRPAAMRPLAAHLHDRFTAGLLARTLPGGRLVGDLPT